MRTLTHAQRRVLAAVNALAHDRGYQPTLREVSDTVGVASRSTIHWHVTNLVAAGWLRFDRDTARSLRLGPRVAGSRNGVLLEVVTTFSRCQPCGMDVPSTHVCPLVEGDRYAC